MLRKLERIIALDVQTYSGRATKYIVAYNGKGIPRGILVYSHRCPRKFGRHRMPFLALMDTAIHHRGYGELLFKQFLSEVGYRFFLCCIKTEGVPYKRKNLIDAWNMMCRRYTIYKHNAKDDKYYNFIVDWCEHPGLTVWTHSILFPYHKEAHILVDPQPWLGL